MILLNHLYLRSSFPILGEKSTRIFILFFSENPLHHQSSEIPLQMTTFLGDEDFDDESSLMLSSASSHIHVNPNPNPNLVGVPTKKGDLNPRNPRDSYEEEEEDFKRRGFRPTIVANPMPQSSPMLPRAGLRNPEDFQNELAKYEHVGFFNPEAGEENPGSGQKPFVFHFNEDRESDV